MRAAAQPRMQADDFRMILVPDGRIPCAGGQGSGRGEGRGFKPYATLAYLKYK